MYKKLITGFFSYGLINVLQKSITIILVPLYLSQLSITEYGQLEISLAVYAFISHLFMLQLEAGYQRFFFDNNSHSESRKKYFTSHLTLAFISNLIGIVLFFFFKDYISLKLYSGENLSNLFFIFFSLDLLSRSLTSLMLIALRFKDKKMTFAKAALSDTFTTTFGAYILLMHFGLGLIGIFLAQSLGSITSNIFMFIKLRSDISLKLSLSSIKKSIVYSLYLLPGVMIGWSLSHFSRIFMSTSDINVEQIAIYGLAFKFSIFIAVAVNALKLVWQPVSIEMINDPKSNNFYSKIFDYYIFFLVLFSTFLIVVMEPLIGFIAPSEYYSAINYAPSLISATILNCSSMILSMGIVISKKSYYSSIVTVIGAISNILIMIYGIDTYGVKSIVFAYFISSLIISYLTLFISQKLFFIPYKIYTQFSMIFCCILISIYPLQVFNISMTHYKILIIFLLLLFAFAILEADDYKKFRKLFFVFKRKIA